MIRPIILSFFLALTNLSISLAQSDQPDQRTKFSPSEIRDDLAYLYKTLEQTHYDLYVNTKKEVFEKSYKELYDKISDSLTLLQITRLFQPFVALSELAHCNISFPWNLYFNEDNQTNASLVPFNVTVINNRAFITDNYSSDLSIQKGDELLSIDGVDIHVKLKEVYGFLSGEDNYMKNTLIDVINFSRVYWWIYDSSDHYKIRIKHKDGAMGSVIVNGLKASNYEQRVSKQKSVFRLEREFRFIDSIAYLHPGIFINNQSAGNTSEQKTFETNEFESFIDSSFTKINKTKTEHLIIDLRGNPGGDNAFSDHMIAYFATRPFWFCSEFSVKTSDITKKFWRDVKDSSLQDLKTQILTKKNGEIFKASFKDYEPRKDSLHFKGKVYVLVDKYSYSNAVSVAAIIQDYNFGIVIGEPTADVASSYGAIHEFELPNSLLRVAYPKAFIVRPNGNRSLIGVTPDKIVYNVIFTETDEILDFTIKYINEK